MWAFAVGTSLFVARELLSSGKAKIYTEIFVRATALLAATSALGGFTLASSIISKSGLPLQMGPILWGISVAPLALPKFKKRDGTVFISSQMCVFVSTVLTALGGLTISITILAQLILTNPELI
tara:strand:- start:86 stop:457 length:372 start_codon:yes stop_codon:yes gene_type:complete